MPIFNTFDPAKVTANFTTLPKDDYELVIGEPKAFAKKEEDGITVKNHGVRVGLTVAEGEYKGKRPQPQVCYMHNDGGQSFSKQFLMAAYGYGKGSAEEKRFNEDFAGKDWSYDTDSGAVGDVWRGIVGKRIKISYDMGVNVQTGDEQQTVKGFAPVTA